MIYVVYGTRPEYIKLLPVIRELRAREIDTKVIKVGQHTDLIKDAECDTEIVIEESLHYDRLNELISEIPKALYGQFSLKIPRPELVIVQGDTATAFAAALTAFNLKIPVAHVEAGLRSFDKSNPFPEESYRGMISQIATYHFCPRKIDFANLEEGFLNFNVHVTGNTIIDTISHYRVFEEKNNEVLITLHRRENMALLAKWLDALKNLADEYWKHKLKFTLIRHPSWSPFSHELGDIDSIPPLSHEEFIRKLQRCRLVITDSGGLVEEASYFRVWSIVCRKVTERPYEYSKLVADPTYLAAVFNEVLNSGPVPKNTEFGDGTAAKKIVNIINDRILNRV